MYSVIRIAYGRAFTLATLLSLTAEGAACWDDPGRDSGSPFFCACSVLCLLCVTADPDPGLAPRRQYAGGPGLDGLM